MKYNKQSIDFLFGLYNQSSIIEDLNKLKCFSFQKGALNPYAADGDELVIHFNCNEEKDQATILNTLGAKSIKNNSGYVTACIEEIDIHIYQYDSYFSLFISNTDEGLIFTLTDDQLTKAIKLEEIITKNELENSITFDHQIGNGKYVNRINYPELFE